MNDANIDNLFRLTAPLPETSLFAAPRTRDDVPPFDRHLREAGTATLQSPIESSSSTTPKPRRETDSPTNSSADDHRNYDSSAPVETDDSIATESSDIDQPKSEPDEFTPSNAANEVGNTNPTGGTADVQRLNAKQSDPKAAPADKPNGSPRRGGRKHAVDGNPQARGGDGKVTSDSAPKQAKGDAQSTSDGTASKAKHADKKFADPSKSHDRDETAVPTSKDATPEKIVAVDDAAKRTQSQVVAAELRTATPSEEAAASTTEGKRSDSLRAAGNATNHKSDKPNRAGTTHESPDKAGTKRDATANKTAPDESQGNSDAPSKESVATTKTAIESGKEDKESNDDSKTDASRPRAAAGARPVSTGTTPVAAGIATPLEYNATASVDSQAGEEKVLKVSAGNKEGTLATFARYERTTASGARSGQEAGDAKQTPQADPARFVTRVARAITTAQDRGGPLHLRLSPPELGSLRLELSVKDGALTAHVETDNPTARQVLLDNLPSLRDRLAEQNMRIDRFDVDVRQDGTGGQQSFTAQQRQNQQQHAPSNIGNTSNLRRASGIEAADAVAPERHAITDTSINLVI
jgi:flagellar hook-length control protein FliK